MFVKKSTHDAVVAELDRLTDRLAQVRDEKRVIGAALKEALDELEPLKAARQRSMANLSAWNAKRRRSAALSRLAENDAVALS